MVEENDFRGFDWSFFSTSQVGQESPSVDNKESSPLGNARKLHELLPMDVIVTTQGGGYTEEIYHQLRELGWNGYWIDAASTLRMNQDSVIVLDPVNRHAIDEALNKGIKNFIGGNCTVSLMLMALGGLISAGWVKWVTSMTYQAASGAGSRAMCDLIQQMRAIGNHVGDLLDDSPMNAIAEIDRRISDFMRSDVFPAPVWGVPLAASLIPWIDRLVEGGQTREEWKGFAEANKILGRQNDPIPIDGQCVRIGTMRCHSLAFTIKLSENYPLSEIEERIVSHNPWVQVVPNNQEETIRELTPVKVTGTLSIRIGRIRKMNLGSDYLTAFAVGDQLLWGAAEPIRRILKIVLEHLG
jgi:aspartate-semialdehyde dehydrogenase